MKYSGFYCLHFSFFLFLFLNSNNGPRSIRLCGSENNALGDFSIIALAFKNVMKWILWENLSDKLTNRWYWDFFPLQSPVLRFVSVGGNVYKLKVKLVKSLIWNNVLGKAFYQKSSSSTFPINPCWGVKKDLEHRWFCISEGRNCFAMRNEDVMYVKWSRRATSNAEIWEKQ